MPAEDRIITLKERKEAERMRREAAVSVLRDRLRAYGETYGGRFLLYGSALRGTMRYNSDIDILVDFPADTKAAAWDHVESLGAELGVTLDINYADWCSPAFLAHIKAIPIP